MNNRNEIVFEGNKRITISTLSYLKNTKDKTNCLSKIEELWNNTAGV